MRNEELGIIERIRIFPAKGDKGIDLAEARLIENLGIEGDFHTKAGDSEKPDARQISLQFTGNGESENAQAEMGLCNRRFKGNITIKRRQTSFLAGTRFTAGEAVLEISGETKRCHEECPLFREGKTCSLAGTNLFARVIKGGIIRIGDRLEPCIQISP